MNMSDEETQIEEIKRLIAGKAEASPEVLRKVEAALASNSNSSQLWVWRGILIQLGSDPAAYTTEDVEASFKRAVELDPNNAEAFEELGYLYDAVLNDLSSALAAFRKAVALDVRPASVAGLARVLAELGDREGALGLLASPTAKYYDAPEVVQVRQEIESGMWSPE